MRTENAVLAKMAWESLKGKWGLAIGSFVVYLLVVLALGAVPKIGPLVSLVIGGPMYLGITLFFLSISRNQDARLEQIFSGFSDFVTPFLTYLLMIIFVFLWTLLLIIPGIIAALSYSMAFYILVDNPGVKPMEAIDKSKKMMYGYKWKLFCLYLRFLGWGLLCILTLGIGLLWVGPYAYVSFAKFYDDIKDHPASA